MGTRYEVEDCLVAREDSQGNIASNPTLLRLCVTENTIKEEKEYSDVNCILREAPIRKEGKSSVSGGFKYALDSNTIDFTITHLLGDKISVADFTSETWQPDTVMAIGDYVNTSDGKWTMYVIRVDGDAKTGSNEPAPIEKGQIIKDNNVTFIADRKLIKSIVPLSKVVPKFTAEIVLKDTVDGTIFRKQYRHLELDKLPITIDGSGSYEVSVNAVGGVAVDEDSEKWNGSLTEISGAKIAQEGEDELGGSCELTEVLINGNEAAIDAINLTIDKGLSVVDLPNCNTRTTRSLKITGTIDEEFTKEEYIKIRDRNKFEYKSTIKSKSGAYIEWFFPAVEPEFADPDIKSKTEVLLSSNINAIEKDKDTPACYATIVVPQMVDADGNVIGNNGAW